MQEEGPDPASSPRPAALVIDADAGYRESLGYVLRAHGLRPLFAADGISAMSLVTRGDAALICCSYEMQAGNGETVLERLLQRGSAAETKLIALCEELPTAPPPGVLCVAREAGALAIEEHVMELLDAGSLERRSLLYVLGSDEELEQALALTFPERSFEVVCCQELGPFLQRIEARRPDLLLLDLTSLPDAVRLALRELELREDFGDLPCIVLGSTPEQCGEVEEEHLGVSTCVTAPIESRSLRSAVLAELSARS